MIVDGYAQIDGASELGKKTVKAGVTLPCRLFIRLCFKFSYVG